MSNLLIQGEAKYLPFLLKSRRTGRVLNLVGASFSMALKAQKTDLTPVVSKVNSQFDISQIALGKVSVWLTASDTYQLAPMVYYGELRIAMPGSPGPIYKVPFEIKIEETGLPDGILAPTISLSVAEQLTTL